MVDPGAKSRNTCTEIEAVSNGIRRPRNMSDTNVKVAFSSNEVEVAN